MAKVKNGKINSKASESSGFYLLFLGVLFHLACLASIFDIYFTSPLTNGVEPVINHLEPPAKRLVLFVGDGLRADKIYSNKGPDEVEPGTETPQPRAPFLHKIINKHGYWGVSHTRMPTESRPGHVAMIAGFYEDVSAVTKGWKENPVEFDHVFNRSRQTWGWGSPDIVTMFTHGKGLSDGHVKGFVYPAQIEDFGTQDARVLDTWVFDSVTKFFLEADDDLKEKLNQNKVVFFLHLLGIDTNGHAHRPFSPEYLENIDYVDAGIRNISKFIEDYYGDGKTAFVFTSDHGMSNRGSHGGGHPDETETPLICWGAGIQTPVQQTEEDQNIDKEFGLFSNSNRKNVNQADIAPLMASLIGSEIPINSVGKLPHEYLSTTDEFKAQSMKYNALQILSSVFKIEEKKREKSLYFKPFPKLTDEYSLEILGEIEDQIKNERWEESIEKSEFLVDLCLMALRYYQTYDRYFLQSVMMISYVGWLCLSTMYIVYNYTPVCHHNTSQRDFEISGKTSRFFIFFTAILVVAFSTLYYSQQGWSYYLYVLFSVIFWTIVMSRRRIISDTMNYVKQKQLTFSVLYNFLLVTIGLESIVLVFFQRTLLCVILFFLSVSKWPHLFTSKSWEYKKMIIVWTLFCLIMSVFPFFSVEKNISSETVIGAATLLAGLIFSLSGPSLVSESFTTRFIINFQIMMVFASSIVHFHSSYSLKQKQGLPYANMLFAWISLGAAFFQPLFLPNKYMIRFFSTVLSFAPPFFLLSLSYESVFYVVLIAAMYVWIRLELLGNMTRTIDNSDLYDSQLRRRFTWEEVRIAYYFVFFLVYAFFAMGNIASVGSFDLNSAYRFITVFSPFIMGGLMIFKLAIPLLMVSCAFNIISQHIIKVESTSLFIVAVALSDIMAINFFFLVRDEGSWMDIGTSISHFVISSAVIICLPIFNFLAFILIGDDPYANIKKAIE